METEDEDTETQGRHNKQKLKELNMNKTITTKRTRCAKKHENINIKKGNTVMIFLLVFSLLLVGLGADSGSKGQL